MVKRTSKSNGGPVPPHREVFANAAKAVTKFPRALPYPSHNSRPRQVETRKSETTMVKGNDFHPAPVTGVFVPGSDRDLWLERAPFASFVIR